MTNHSRGLGCAVYYWLIPLIWWWVKPVMAVAARLVSLLPPEVVKTDSRLRLPLRPPNVGLAAAALNLSPSAVSHGLGRLRRMLDDPLFLRTPRGVVPTDRALELAPRIAEVRGLLSMIGLLPKICPWDNRRNGLDMNSGWSFMMLFENRASGYSRR